MTGQRATNTRTVAATNARRVKAAQRSALVLATRLPLLDDIWLATLGRVLLEEMQLRDRMAATNPPNGVTT